MKFEKTRTTATVEVYLCTVKLPNGLPCHVVGQTEYAIREHYGYVHAARRTVVPELGQNSLFYAYLDNEDDHKAFSNSYHVIGQWLTPGWYEVDRSGQHEEDSITPLSRAIENSKQEIIRAIAKLKKLRQLSREKV